MTNKIEDTLKERGSRYGEFHTQSEYAQGLKRIFQKSPNWNRMTDDQREALDMFANKIGRILNGDPDYGDSWHDIAGYAELVEKRIEERKRLKDEAKERYNQKVNDYINETGDCDTIHLEVGKPIPPKDWPRAWDIAGGHPTVTLQAGQTYTLTGSIIKDSSYITKEPYTSPCSVASVERGEVLGICPQRPESEMDALAPEVCVSRCY